MKNFYMKYKNQIGIVIDTIIIVLGLLVKNYLYTIMGVVLLALTLYVARLEKQDAKEKARIIAEKKAIKAEQKRLNKGKKKEKEKKIILKELLITICL